MQRGPLRLLFSYAREDAAAEGVYQGRPAGFVQWGVLNVSDHLPLWVELAT